MEKGDFIFYAKVVVLIIYAMLTIITCAGVWNNEPEGFVKVCAVLLFIANGISIYSHAKKLKREDK